MADFVIVNSIRGIQTRNEQGSAVAPEIYEAGEEDDFLQVEKPDQKTLARLAKSGAIVNVVKPVKKARRKPGSTKN